MIRLLLLLIVVAVGAIVYPRYAEHTEDVCAAFAKRLDAQMPAPPGAYSNAATNYMQTQYPRVPATIRCTIAYWATVVTPDVAETAKRLLPGK